MGHSNHGDMLVQNLRQRLDQHGLVWQKVLQLQPEDLEHLLRDVLMFDVIKRNKIMHVLRAKQGLASPNALNCSHVFGECIPSKDTMENENVEGEAPMELLCPITNEVMDDPVFTSDGHTYGHRAILKWFMNYPGSGLPISPNTGLPLKTLELTPNLALKSQVVRWREQTGIPATTTPTSENPDSPISDTLMSSMSTPRGFSHSNTLSFFHGIGDGDDDDSEGNNEIISRLQRLRDTVARSQESLNLMQQSVNRVRQELERSQSGGLQHSITPHAVPSLRPATLRPQSLAPVSAPCSCGTCTDCRIAAHTQRYGWLPSSRLPLETPTRSAGPSTLIRLNQSPLITGIDPGPSGSSARSGRRGPGLTGPASLSLPVSTRRRTTRAIPHGRGFIWESAAVGPDT
mmetsp:Transcript_81517/g.143743  ORF Transcript_81517/g.143743 Transcript_81517/m.143743 type:complete len:402 (-) Transcript_81517:16-1221(-)